MHTPAKKREFEKFYEEHFDKVYRFVFFRSGGDRETTEALVSEIFMKALQHFKDYDVKISKSAWIMTITRNHLFNHWRDTKKTYALPQGEDEDGEFNSDSFWLKLGIQKWQKETNRQEAVQYLTKLEPEEAEIVTFHYLIGYNYAEIGQMKGMSEGAVKVAAHRAIKKLRSFTDSPLEGGRLR